MSSEFFSELKEAFNEGDPFVLALVVETDGSSPGKVGQKMLIYHDGSTEGTVGGGVNEERVRQAAVELFHTGGSKVLTFAMDNPIDGTEPVCGGTMKVYLELLVDRPRLVIFGGGHIGRVLAKLASIAHFRVTLVDQRPEFADPKILPEVDQVVCAPYEASVDTVGLDARTSVVIVTPGHSHDLQVLRRVVPSPAPYVGMIGSARKVEEMKKTLLAEGADPERLAALFAPIGINLGGQTPEEIAVAILAQIIAFRNGKIIHYQR
ncbi:MAG: Xanthine and CO dehydrogenases maturation factor, XdhC/CoxF family [Candidatus Ozemobacter sibiricus]|jgi:xanthine dehydrogenase accessory factor|uniref:Xanthine and CO dehydrogenases maturation factor, XdhC/CoxF family n=1 Tax=Candidatus Ozemobacter sibiricus TaxID=2268124 RepID=A0A367ZKS5_9BACT|nr:MAG: Xanthine and CO dehydrogenases maturation factor, XdhC/CoxF family [Candidatus Ozemobacter sibiricus]